MKKVNFLIDDEQLKSIDDLVGHHGFTDRSDVIRSLLEWALDNNEVIKKGE